MDKKSNMPLIIAHRGASNIAPENTLLAFQKAIDLKADLIEFDLQETKDNYLVVTHDEDLSRLTGFKGFVENLTLKELKELDFGDGESIPTLDELIGVTRGKIGLNCEIKVSGIAEKTIEIMRRYKIIDSTIISSFLHDELLKVQMIEPKIRIASLEPTISSKTTDWSEKEKMIQYCIDNNFYAINPLAMMVDKQFVDHAHEFNIKVFPWTVDLKILIKKLVKFGVDGIITNDVETVRDVCNKLKY